MKKSELFKYTKLSQYFKLVVVLLIDTLSVCSVIRVMNAEPNTDFFGLLLLIMFFFFLVFNLWVFIMYHITKRIEKLWLRDVLFYLLLFLYPCSPLMFLTNG